MASTLEADESSIDLTTASADQSCKECRRRKARCNRGLPTCGLCLRNGRHCLYEKHSRTPLTRKHLTEVEERLERAEALIRKLRQSSVSNTSIHGAGAGPPLVAEASTTLEQPFNFSDLDRNAPRSSPALATNIFHEQPAHPPVSRETQPGMAPDIRPDRTKVSADQIISTRRSSVSIGGANKITNNFPETPPRDDFEWDEQDFSIMSQSEGPQIATNGSEAEPIADGMASLSVSENETGYLGVASGAALLRIMELSPKRRNSRSRPPQIRAYPSPTMAPNPNRHIADSMIDAYFRGYHLSYPIIHEPTFRAQYSEVIPQPHGRSWQILAYTVAAIGVYASSDAQSTLDLALFAQAKAMLTFDFLEVGNLTLVQALTLISNYQQKRGKPNSGYNYLGLAVRMATGLGLHKEFSGWNISPLKMEIRRRVWWSLCVFDVGAIITFSRPMVWPYEGVEVTFPLNVNDRDLTANSVAYPQERHEITPYTAVSVQARFHVSTNQIYSRVISTPLPTAEELLQMDKEFLQSWLDNLPEYFREDSNVPSRYAMAHAVMQWRHRNFRIIMFRPFVIRMALNRGHGQAESSTARIEACQRCLTEAAFTIKSIADFSTIHEHNRLSAWYALYFLFQAALIPCICLRNMPQAPEAPMWCEQVALTLKTIQSLVHNNPSASSCYSIIMDLCGPYLSDFNLPMSLDDNNDAGHDRTNPTDDNNVLSPGAYNQDAQPMPINESPQTQINHMMPMMWPNINVLEAADVVMGNEAWLSFLGNEMPGDYQS